MEAPHLKLVILQGPRKGESVEYPPGTAVQIGRLVRGNNLPIKDPGISSNHLSILPESNNWFLHDLDSSNGTVFNGTNIRPNTPCLLHDGATIKIGEFTSIHVTLLQHHDAAAAPSQPNRIPTHRGRTGPAEPAPDVGGSDDAPVLPKRGRGRGKGLKGTVQAQSVEENAIANGSGFVDPPENKRVTRNSKNKRGAAVAISDSAPIEKVEEPKKTRATRNLKNKQSVVEASSSSALQEKVVEEPKKTRATTRKLKSKESVIEVSDSSAVEKKVVEEPKNNRVTRNLKKNKESVIEVSDPSVLEEKAVEEPKNTRATRNAKKGKGMIGKSPPRDSSLVCRVVENVEVKKTSGGDRSELEEECAQAVELEGDKVDEAGPSGDGADKNEDSVKGGGDYGTREEEGCSAQKEELNGEGNWPDMEKLSLAEWFDFLEVQLPKQIVDSTEEMIESMRQTAERLREYIIQQKNDKGKMLL